MKTFDLHCQFKNNSPFTVGDKKTLICEKTKSFSLKTPLEFEGSQDFMLKFLKISEKSDSKVVMEVTSYRTGQHQESFILKDSLSEFSVKPLSFEVKSVLKKESKPIPFFEAYKIRPWSLIILVVLTSLIFISLVSYFSYSFLKKKKLKKQAKDLFSGLSPLRELDLKIYRLKSSYEASLITKKSFDQDVSNELLSIFKIYLSSVFQISVVDLEKKEILETLLKYEKDLFLKVKTPITSLFKELEYLKHQPVKEETFYWMIQEFKNNIDKIEKVLKKR